MNRWSLEVKQPCLIYRNLPLRSVVAYLQSRIRYINLNNSEVNKISRTFVCFPPLVLWTCYTRKTHLCLSMVQAKNMSSVSLAGICQVVPSALRVFVEMSMLWWALLKVCCESSCRIHRLELSFWVEFSCKNEEWDCKGYRSRFRQKNICTNGWHIQIYKQAEWHGIYVYDITTYTQPHIYMYNIQCSKDT